MNRHLEEELRGILLPGPRAPQRVSSHIDLGTINVSTSFLINVRSTWSVQNTGPSDGFAGIKMTIIETKAFQIDKDWFQYTPLSREGGPGKTDDLLARQTGDAFRAAVLGTTMQRIPAGATVELSVGVQWPGPTLDPLLDSFWFNNHPKPTFKVVVEVIELADLAGKFERSIASHTFDTAFDTLAQRVSPALLSAVELPTLAVTTF